MFLFRKHLFLVYVIICRWYPLKNKPGAKKAEKYRGEIEVKVTFVVQSMSSSDMNISKMGKIKRASSIKSLVGKYGAPPLYRLHI